MRKGRHDLSFFIQFNQSRILVSVGWNAVSWLYRHCDLKVRPLCPADHHELQQKMEKKERECDAKTQEKEEMMQTLNKMKEKLEREMGEHKLVKQQVVGLTARLHDLSTVG